MVLAERALTTIVAVAKAVLFYSRTDTIVRALHFHKDEVGKRDRESWIMAESIEYRRKVPSVCY